MWFFYLILTAEMNEGGGNARIDNSGYPRRSSAYPACRKDLCERKDVIALVLVRSGARGPVESISGSNPVRGARIPGRNTPNPASFFRRAGRADTFSAVNSPKPIKSPQNGG